MESAAREAARLRAEAEAARLLAEVEAARRRADNARLQAMADAEAARAAAEQRREEEARARARAAEETARRLAAMRERGGVEMVQLQTTSPTYVIFTYVLDTDAMQIAYVAGEKRYVAWDVSWSQLIVRKNTPAIYALYRSEDMRYLIGIDAAQWERLLEQRSHALTSARAFVELDAVPNAVLPQAPLRSTSAMPQKSKPRWASWFESGGTAATTEQSHDDGDRHQIHQQPAHDLYGRRYRSATARLGSSSARAPQPPGISRAGDHPNGGMMTEEGLLAEWSAHINTAGERALPHQWTSAQAHNTRRRNPQHPGQGIEGVPFERPATAYGTMGMEGEGYGPSSARVDPHDGRGMVTLGYRSTATVPPLRPATVRLTTCRLIDTPCSCSLAVLHTRSHGTTCRLWAGWLLILRSRGRRMAGAVFVARRRLFRTARR